MKRQQSGFTLVEIAIVLVIIGLLLGGVLKGQELINSAKAKAVISDFRNTATMIAAYQDRFRALPGDDKAATTHVGSTTVNGDGDGMIEGAWNSVVATADTTSFTHESAYAWQQLRLANLTSGSSAAPSSGTWEPQNTEGGRIGIQSAVPYTNMRGRIFVCQSNVSGRIALQVDTTMDDGTPNAGSVQIGAAASTSGTTGATPVASASAVDENTLYVVCASF
ncbi:prepilin-type N-terminal cleavage/methylation domain-containing protein [Uliginosibacterium sp. TH139]|jgi:prepilin-type N-terminal cleavage/methylation domain-containing protein|uniref:prepilin-type N-terminal cleavage/methylation domain-containing protein n=1 Tax=Uliginosibacterium sp. TH139 TaxID=2067453 RepID=UPI000C7DE93A|nr:prepilin-type N-terminal cleavage/methylation domain-containing protein [Uliginosibacterium sp. TH139]PLK47206.1 prepilin-type cleavage/methylation domain-containing protein [Uliginosibacterium sp. TH139]